MACMLHTAHWTVATTVDSTESRHTTRAGSRRHMAMCLSERGCPSYILKLVQWDGKAILDDGCMPSL